MNVPFLRGRSLGEVCHIVQLAISVKKILGYHRGKIVPYDHSSAQAKAKCAEQLQRFASGADEGFPAATWDNFPAYLQCLLTELPAHESGIRLSNLKSIFQARFHTTLSETVLGHTKLSELLDDAQLRSICFVRLKDNGYIVAPQRQHLSISDLLAEDSEDTGGAASASTSWPLTPATTVPVAVTPATTSPHQSESSESARATDTDVAESAEGASPTPRGIRDRDAGTSPKAGMAMARTHCHQAGWLEECGLQVQNTFLQARPSLEGVARRRTRSWSPFRAAESA